MNEILFYWTKYRTSPVLSVWKSIRLFHTFHCNVDALVCGQLWLHQHITRVFSFIHLLLHVKQFQGAVVLEGPLSVVVRQQIGVLVPLDGVVGVANDTAVDVHVPPSDGSEVFHWSDAGRPLKDTLERQLS